MLKRDSDPTSDLKLPSGPAARRSRFSRKNEWTETDRAERRRTLIIIGVVATVLLAGVVLIVSGV